MVLTNIQLKSNQNIYCPPVTQGLNFKRLTTSNIGQEYEATKA